MSQFRIMIPFKRLHSQLSLSFRCLSSIQSLKKDSVKSNEINIFQLQSGIRCALVSEPDSWKGMTHISAVFDTGSRYEPPSARGISHVLRRTCCLSTDSYTAVNLTRHIQQMGCELRCVSTRERMIYSMDVAPNLASRAAYLLAHIATRTAFYDWELKDITNKLMLKDIDVLTRRRLDAFAVELLHEAAYSTHPLGSGLGNSLFAASDKVGSFSLEDIQAFLERHVNPLCTTLVISGSGSKVSGVDVCNIMQEALRLNPCQDVACPEFGFVGGDIRRNLSAAEVTHAALAWPTKGRSDKEEMLALAIGSRALCSPAHFISYSLSAALLNPDSPTHQEAVLASPLYHVYSDQGLFGLMVSGGRAVEVAERLSSARRTLDRVAARGLSKAECQRGRVRLRNEIMMRLENHASFADDLALQLAENGESVYHSHEEIAQLIEKMSLEVINMALKKTLSKPKAALAVVGADTSLIPPLDHLLTV